MAAKLRIKIKRPGRLHRNLGIAMDKRIPTAKLSAAKQSADPAVRKQANFAFNARKWNHG